MEFFAFEDTANISLRNGRWTMMKFDIILCDKCSTNKELSS